MRIRRLHVKNFRGIKTLEWTVQGTTICLIGPNDSTKSTILHSIEKVLSPKWNPTFTDTDFYNCDSTQSIKIELVITGIPASLMSLDKYGDFLVGWHSEDGRLEEPTEDSESAFTVQLTVDQSLEPVWEVCCSRGSKRITASDRQALGLAYVAAYVDRDFSWGKGTPLSRITGSLAELNLSEINRQARQAIDGIKIDALDSASSDVQTLSKSYGVKPTDKFKPAFDPDSISIHAGTLALHDGKVPIRQYGLGSKRLVSLAIQKSMTTDGAIVLIDEIEHGLEPFRLRQLLRVLRPPTTPVDGAIHPAQVIMTSHSTITLVELQANELCITRSQDGTTSVTQVSSELQALVRSAPEALLCPRIIVCEGKTEVGFLRAMDSFWSLGSEGESLAFHGVTLVDGEGNTKAPSRAIEIKQLGYDVLLFVDSDKSCNPTVEDVENADVKVIIWDGTTNIEGRIFLDLPIATILKIVDVTLATLDEQDVLSGLGSELRQSGMNREKLEQLLNDPAEEHNTRLKIGKVASSKGKSWFKRTDLAEEIGKLTAEALKEIPSTDLSLKLQQIKDWVYGND